MKHWDRMVRDVRAGGDIAPLNAEVGLYAYHFACRRGHEEIAADVWLRMQKRLPALIRKWTSIGRFAAYVTSTCKLMIRDALRIHAERLRHERAVNQADKETRDWGVNWQIGGEASWEQIDSTADPTESHAQQLPDLGTSSPAMRRSLLIAAIKHGAGADELAHLTAVTDLDINAQAVVDQLTAEKHASKGSKLATLRVRRDRAHHEALRLEAHLLDPYNGRREEAEARLQRARKTRRRAQNEIRGLRVTPSHADIARATGLPKGTVDTAIYRLRHSPQAP